MSTRELPDLAATLRRSPVRPPVMDQTTEPVQETVAVMTDTDPPKASPRRRAPRKKAPRPQETGVRHTVSYYLRGDLRDRVTEAAQAQGSSVTAWLLVAVNRYHARLSEGLTSNRAHEVGEGLFPVPQAHGTMPRRVQSSLRLTSPQLNALDQLAAQHDVDRNAVLAAAARVAVDEWLLSGDTSV